MVSRRGQAEFGLILGLAIVAVFVAFFALITVPSVPTEPSSLSDDQRAVEAYVKDAIQKSAETVITKIYYSGGYYEFEDQRTAEFFGSDVAYWQMCNTEYIPNIEANFIDGLEKDLKKFIPEETHIAGRQIVFDIKNVDVKAEFYDSSISLAVTMATKLDRSYIPQPYRIEIPTKLKRITDFAKDFTRFQIKYRALDRNLMKIVNRTNPVETDEGACWLPTMGLYSGRVLKKSWTPLRGCMEKAIDYTLGNTLEWLKPIMRGETLPLEMLDYVYIFNIETEDGWGQYADLDADFYMGGEDVKLTRGNPEFTFRIHPDPVKFKMPLNMFVIPPMVAYDVKYDVSFPVVINVYDDLSERSFMFTNFVNIRKSVPSNNCSETQTADPTAELCDINAGTPVTITLESYEPAPNNRVPHAHVSYGICEMGTTDGGGVISRDFPTLPAGTRLTFTKEDPPVTSEYSICVQNPGSISPTIKFPMNKNFRTIIRIIDIVKIPSPPPQSGLIYRAVPRYPYTDDDRIQVSLDRKNIPCMDPEEYVIMNYKPDFEGEEIIYTIYPYAWPSREITLPATAEYDVDIGIETKGIADMDAVIDYNWDTLYVYAPNFETADKAHVERLFNSCGLEPIAGEEFNFNQGCEIIV